jgi:hypothetical protein
MKLICACCGGYAPSRKQWWNQDTGYSICPECFTRNIEHEKTALHNDDALAHELFSYGVPGIHHSIDEMPQLFYHVLACRVKYASHATDLYLPATDQVRAILKQYPTHDANKTEFTNQVEGGTWYDIPFAYLPAWEAKAGKAAAT